MTLVNQEIMSNSLPKKQMLEKNPVFNQPSCRSSISQHFSLKMCVQQKNEQSSRKSQVKIKRKDVSYLQRIYKSLDICHIHNFLDQIFINEETIRNQENDESMLKTLFYMRTITKIEVTSSMVKMWLKSNDAPSKVPYVIERFNSFGDSYFHNIANSLEKMYQFFCSRPPTTNSQGTERVGKFDLTRQNIIQQFLKSVSGKPYFMKILPDEYLFSNELITILGSSIEDFTQDCLKYRVMMEDFFTSDNYKMLLQQNIGFLSCYVEFLKGNITMEKVLEASDITFTSFLRAKNERRIKVLVRGFMPNPYIFCMIIEKVFSEELCSQKLNTFNQGQKNQFEKQLLEEKQTILQKIYMPTRGNQGHQNSKRCGYAPKPRRRRRKSECDYEY